MNSALAFLLVLVFAGRAFGYELSLSPEPVVGGNLATLVISNCDPGATVYLRAEPGLVNVPQTVTIPPFSTGTSLLVTTDVTASDAQVTIYSGDGPDQGDVQDTITVTVLGAPEIVSVSGPAEAVSGGNSFEVTVTLSGPAPFAGLTVDIATNGIPEAIVPSSVQVAPGASSATFAVMTTGVASSKFVTTAATLLDSAATDRTTLRPARLVDATVLGGGLSPGMNGTLRAVFDGEIAGCGRDVGSGIRTVRGSGLVTIPPGGRAQPGDDFVDIPVSVGNSAACEIADLVVVDPSDGTVVEARVEIRGLNDEIEFVPPFVMNAIEPQAVVIADMDGDGFADIMSARGGATPGVEVFLNDGIGRFPEDPDFGYADDALRDVIDLAAADVVRGDGLTDAILLNRSNASVTVLENLRGSFERAWVAATRVRPTAFAVGDVDGDGVRDYVVTTETNDSIEVLRGTGSGASSTGWVSSGSFPVDVVLGNFDGDGFMDAATACFGNGATGRVGIHMGAAGATLGPATLLPVDAGCVSIVAGDWNGDGRDDLAVSTAASEVVVFLNDGGSWFELERHVTAGVVTEMRASDAESDGDVDIFFALDDLPEAGVLLNTGCGLFDPPDPILLPVDAGPRLAVGLLNRDDRIDVALTRPDDDALLQLLQVGEPCATYIVLTVHGQDGQGFSPLWNENGTFAPHGWPNGAENPATGQGPLFPLLEEFVDEINYSRVNRGLCPVRLLTHEYDWVAMTGRGQRSILASRVMWVLAGPPPWSPEGVLLLTGASVLETAGRLQTRTGSREAAGEVQDVLKDLVEQARYLDPEAPIFIDIICHSRGTTVTSEVLRRFMRGGAEPLGEDVSLSVSYVSVIEPLPFGIPRPGASAGDLMGDPSVDRHATLTRIAHFYENRACVTSGGVCIGTDWFDIGFINWALGLGLDFPVDALVEFLGYPKSIGDGSLSPDTEGLVATDHNAIIAEFSFIEPIDVGLPATIPVGPSGPGVPAPATFNFAWTSYFGDLMRDPTGEDVPEATGWPGSPVRAAASASRGLIPVEIFADATFDESKETVDASDAVLADPIGDELFVPEIGQIGEDLAMTCVTRWPVAGVWAASRPDVRSGASGGDAYAAFERPVQLRQVLDDVASDRDEIDVWVEFEFTGDDGFLHASYSGVGIEACEAWAAEGMGGRMIGRVSGVRLPAFEAAFGAYRGDAFVLWGHGVRVYRVTSVDPAAPTCVGDVNGDNAVNFDDLNILLDRWGETVDPWMDGDVTGDGMVNFDDLNLMADRWGEPCE